MSDIRSFFMDIFWTISSTTLARRSVDLQSDDRLNLLSSENSTHAQSCSVQLKMLTIPLQTGSTVLSGQWDTHNRSALSARVLLPSNGSSFSEDLAPGGSKN
ncbi:hypothetical protein TNCV_5084461 [Trichonephila clavipes]|nr:hypothetical protein TNCV_5084461 [Trichonephila clavipes]